MIKYYYEIKYEDRKLINFVLDENNYTKEIFIDNHYLFWCYGSESYLVEPELEEELEKELKYYYREQKLIRIKKYEF